MQHEQRLPLKQLTTLVKDLQQPSPAIYYFDLGCCVAVTAVGMYLSRPFDGSSRSIIGVLIAALAVYRASFFSHEIAHHPRRLSHFELVWNLTIGIAILSPSFLYYNHFVHHGIHSSGSDDDSEYVATSLVGARGFATMLLGCLLLPFTYIVRFSVLQIAAWLNPSARRWVDENVSTYGAFGLAKGRGPTTQQWWSWRLQEIGCFLLLPLVAVAVVYGVVPPTGALRFYIVVVLVLFLHMIRVIATNRYESGGLSQDRIEQFLDAFNITRSCRYSYLAACLLAPLGLGFHALHHLFPKIPYHRMGEAHRRITAALPTESIYHSVESPGYFRVLADFIRRSRRSLGRWAVAG